MTAPEAAPSTSATSPSAPSWRDSLAVYLQPRVLIVMLLGFSSGLPLALSGSTLLVWMRESGVDLGTIGLFALVGTPYTLKFLWAPLVDALHVPFFTQSFGRRRGWLVFSQLLLIVAILLLALTDPARSPLFVALGALLVATMSATQDIVVDAFRVESLPESEQAAGMASYVAAYRIGMLISTAGALFIVSGFEGAGSARAARLDVGLCRDGGAGADRHRNRARRHRARTIRPRGSRDADRDGIHPRAERRDRRVLRIPDPRRGLRGARLRGAVQVHRRVLRHHDRAVRDRPRLHRNDYAAIVKGVGLAATLIGGFAGGFVARRYSLAASLWIGGVLQAVANLSFSWLALVGVNQWALAFAITAENFTSAIGTVIFVAYLSALCRNPLHTATQYALLTALAAVGRTYLSSGAGYAAKATRMADVLWICVLVAIPSLMLLAWLQRRGHFPRWDR